MRSSLFLFNALGKSCVVNLFLFSSCFIAIGLLRGNFSNTPISYFFNNVNTHFNLCKGQTDRQTNRQTDRQTDRQAGRKKDRQTDKQTE